MENIIQFFKKLVCGKKRIIPTTQNHLETINKNIGNKILTKISELQEKSYQVDKLRNNECIVCLDENVPFVPLTCIHSICYSCYDKLLESNYFNCPVCNTKMELCHKLYAVVVPCHLEIGILYLPPIYCEKSDSWKEYEVFNPCEIDKLVESCANILAEKYVLLLVDLSFVKVISEMRNQFPNLPVFIIQNK